MTAKHTQGPWLISEDDLRQDPETVFCIGIWSGSTNPDSDASVMVSTVSAFGLHSETHDGVEVVTTAEPEQREIDTAIANARLIASAPKLLKALQEMIDCYADALPNGKERPVVREARAVIAEAIGEQA